MESKNRYKKIFWITLSVLLPLTLWHLLSVSVNQRLLLVSPIAVVERLLTIWTDDGFFSAVWFSFGRIVWGFFLAMFLGVLFAVPAGKFAVVERLLGPYVFAMKSVPVVSFIIICLLWLSSSQLSIFIAFLMVFPLVYTNILQGMKSLDKGMLQMATVFEIGWARRIYYIYLPHLKPYLLSACNVSLGMAWKAGIAAEVIGIPRGSIGERLHIARIHLNTADLFAWTVIIVVISLLFEKLFLFLLKRMFSKMEGCE
ncbi:MAG: ABC transporter permease subunit [Oscillospiraceae bacterium]|nr:ABC transporter permease subunit [Oscillospiraceae bacterium]